jgi:flagellar basal body rod protein FlgG
MKPYGLYTAAHALRYWESRQQVAAHNLANVDTRGFKGERVFARLLGDSYLAAETGTDYRPGSLTPTGGPLDLALEGDGYFVVETPEGERLTRGGALRLDETGRLVDQGGNAILGERGPIVVPPGQVEIDRLGIVRVDGGEIGRLRVETVAPGTQLERDAAGRFVPDATRTTLPHAERRVRQGHLEESNVNAIESMVELITVQRSFAAVQNTVRVIDGVMDTMVNQIGRAG